MATNWKNNVGENVQKIVQAAQAMGDAAPMCLLVDVDEARAGRISPGAMNLIAGTKMQGAVALTDPDRKRRFACLPVGREQFFKSLEEYEQVEAMRKDMKISGTLVLWAACIERDEWTRLNVHIATHEAN